MTSSNSMVNAWIFLNEDEPSETNYDSPTSCFQALIQNNVYQAVDMLFICFAATAATGANTIPSGDGSSYTLQMGASSHPGGLTNQDYMNYVLRDARAANPNIKFMMTLLWGDEDTLAKIFSNSNYSDQQNAENFAANLLAYLEYYDLDGFDIDWESPLSDGTSENQMTLLLSAIGAQFQKQTGKKYYLTLSPATSTNLDGAAVNANVDFLNLQLYSGFTSPGEFQSLGIDTGLFAYGAKFESNYQTAQAAYEDNRQNYGYGIFTNWRLNSENFEFEQDQQVELHKLVFPND